MSLKRIRLFEEAVRKAFAEVSYLHSYIDTVQLLASDLGGWQAIERLRKEGHKLIPRSTGHYPWALSLRIHQPDAAVLTKVETLIGSHLINRIDIAFDYIFDTKEARAPARLHQFLREHLTQPHHGKRRTTMVDGETLYLAKPWHGRNIVMYSNRPSKIGGAPCVHVELRFYSTAQTRRLGASTISGLLGIDQLATLQKHCRLSRINSDNLRRGIEEMITASMKAWAAPAGRTFNRGEATAKINNIMARAMTFEGSGQLATDLSQIPAQVWLESYRRLVGRGVVHVPMPLIKGQNPAQSK